MLLCCSPPLREQGNGREGGWGGGGQGRDPHSDSFTLGLSHTRLAHSYTHSRSDSLAFGLTHSDHSHSDILRLSLAKLPNTLSLVPRPTHTRFSSPRLAHAHRDIAGIALDHIKEGPPRAGGGIEFICASWEGEGTDRHSGSAERLRMEGA